MFSINTYRERNYIVSINWSVIFEVLSSIGTIGAVIMSLCLARKDKKNKKKVRNYCGRNN